MENLIGHVIDVTGKYFSQDSSGESRILSIGDTINTNNLVLGDSLNTSDHFIKIETIDGNTISLNGPAKQLFDRSMINDEIEMEQISPESIAQLFSFLNQEELTHDDLVLDNSSLDLSGLEDINIHEVKPFTDMDHKLTASDLFNSTDESNILFLNESNDISDLYLDASFGSSKEVVIDDHTYIQYTTEYNGELLTLNIDPTISIIEI